jgi:diguanylate cyclase (GGDEF)-like protein
LLLVGVLVSSLRKSLDLEKELSSTDHLTKALNSRAFMKVLDQEITRSLRYHHPISLVYLDIDNFKTVNDLFGHNVGDRVLATISHVIRNSIRQNDSLGRLGGDEFAILLVETGPDEACTAVSKLQETLMLAIKKNNWPISLSFGVLSCTETFCTPEKMISLADQLMYSVKKSTKNNAKFAIYSDVQEEIRQSNG